MKLHSMMQFKSKIEKKRHYFDLPTLPDSEWQYMFQKAKMESMKKKEFNPLYAFMCSVRLSLALSLAIVLILTLSLFYVNDKGSSIKTNTASSDKTVKTIVNVVNSSFI
ncbi:hypothetical protein [uncultured Brachyspira sp.]|uniref:hypothetical protein n=1 Tax=uncultured Brachyspira sp. TaxID=221953 RepID=UPI0025F9355A|nr:hypothetical protein [uncultured Brachyspira sp.]